MGYELMDYLNMEWQPVPIIFTLSIGVVFILYISSTPTWRQYIIIVIIKCGLSMFANEKT